jgi:hypothetical protein
VIKLGYAWQNGGQIRYQILKYLGERERERESPISIVLQYLYSVRRPQGHHTFSWPLGIPMDVCDIYHYKLFLLGGGFFLKEKIQHYSSKNLAKQHRLKFVYVMIPEHNI